ncbi:MAG: NusA-like transcription termination signal-binding factor [Candidatus Thermoplasmatota archaeon]|nr:NusA-like transcription termination signal-binding factor [Candidatus Thermoplasmatota archaeon]
MKEVTIDNRMMENIVLFERLARTEVKEYLENEDMIVYVVGEKRIGEIFKHGGDLVARLREKTGKHILMAEQSRDLLTFVRNLLIRFGIKEIYITWKEGLTEIQVVVEQEGIGKVIGKEGRNIKLFRDTIQRFFPIKNISVKQ